MSQGARGGDQRHSPVQAKKEGRIAGRGKDFFDGKREAAGGCRSAGVSEAFVWC
jgi:hypothetical protein